MGSTRAPILSQFRGRFLNGFEKSFEIVLTAPLGTCENRFGSILVSFLDHFLEIFAKFSQVFPIFCKFFEDFGLALTRPHLVRCVWMRSDASGKVRMHLDAFGKIRKKSEILV